MKPGGSVRNRAVPDARAWLFAVGRWLGSRKLEAFGQEPIAGPSGRWGRPSSLAPPRTRRFEPREAAARLAVRPRGHTRSRVRAPRIDWEKLSQLRRPRRTIRQR
ncbi:MAG: hypothetical protein Kow0092_03670 [Deferrisomatales bacterium]